MDSDRSPILIQSGPEWHETGLAYRYLLPEGPGPYPTAVLIHGRQGDEDVMWIFRRAIPRPWLVVAPRAPLIDKNGFSWLRQPYHQWPDLSHFDAAVDALTRFAHVLPRLYNADPDRLYLMGFSQGAAVSLAAILRDPALARGLAGLAGFAPVVDDAAVAGRLAGRPVFWASGVRDNTIPLEQSRRAAELLRRAGADLTYREYRTGHKLSAEGLRNLHEWFSRLS
jgi:phospholipase/carboxylesterase